MKQAIIHIGTEKTGSSTLQYFLAGHRDVLLETHGVLYPKSIGINNHQRLCLFAAPNSPRTKRMRLRFNLTDDKSFIDYKKELLESLKDEISKNRLDKLLISSEHLSSRLSGVEEISKLKDLFNELQFQVKIIIYFRRQDELIPSELSTSLKVGNPVHLDPLKHNFWYNYYSLASSWSEVFGKENIICKPFEISGMVNNNLIDDFLTVLDVKVEGASSYKDDFNTSLDAKMLKFLERFNSRVPFIDTSGTVNPVRGNIASLLEQYQSGLKVRRKIEFSPLDKKAVLARYADENANLKKYFGVCLNLEIDHNKAPLMTDLAFDEAFDVFGYLWGEKQAEIIKLRKANKSLRQRMKMDKS